MNIYKRPELETNPAHYPGQIVNPVPEAMLYKPSHGGYPDASPCRCNKQAESCVGCPYATVGS